jgi:Fic family protein
VSQRSAWREWLAFFLAGIEEQARDANARAKRLQDLQLEWRRRLTQARASALLPRLADALFDSPVITIPQAQRILQVTYHSAQHNVEKLVEAGILTPHSGSATGKTFRAEDILHTTGEDTARELYF